MFTTLSWPNLVNLLKNCKIVGHAVSGGRVTEIRFIYDNGHSIKVPAGCREVEIHID